jgi:hypothetical protein
MIVAQISGRGVMCASHAAVRSWSEPRVGMQISTFLFIIQNPQSKVENPKAGFSSPPAGLFSTPG